MASDEALYERLVEGDLDAFDVLYKRYERPLFGFLLGQLGGDRAEAEEVFHESFLAILREREQGREIRSFRAWIYRVARNVCLNRLRGRRRAARAMETEARTPPAAADEPERALMRQEKAAALRGAVARLPEPLGELYALRAGGMSYEELSEVLDVPLGTVKSRMSAMLSCLRQEMKQ